MNVHLNSHVRGLICYNYKFVIHLLHTFVGMKFHLIFSSTIYFFVKSDVYIFNLGEFGVHKGMDKSAVGWDHIEKVEKHESQKGKKDIFKKKAIIVNFEV